MSFEYTSRDLLVTEANLDSLEEMGTLVVTAVEAEKEIVVEMVIGYENIFLQVMTKIYCDYHRTTTIVSCFWWSDITKEKGTISDNIKVWKYPSTPSFEYGSSWDGSRGWGSVHPFGKVLIYLYIFFIKFYNQIISGIQKSTYVSLLSNFLDPTWAEFDFYSRKIKILCY